MQIKTKLSIGLAKCGRASHRLSLNSILGGPDELLNWLETQLGLLKRSNHRANRITEFAACLEKNPNASYSASLAVDRWATASELLSRLDDLKLSGWNSQDRESLPRIVRDIARALKETKLVFPSESDRLQRIVDSLDAGQKLPPHVCELQEPITNWPLVWQKVLSKIDCVQAKSDASSAVSGTSLRAAQDALRCVSNESFVPDPSLRYALARSETTACEFVACVLANSDTDLSQTVIYCSDPHLALRLDACFHRIGLPTMGASLKSQAHPVLQVLPLAIDLCWEPVDPQTLLDFLSLPLKPIPSFAAKKLAAALVDQPGFDSGQWEAAISALGESEVDVDGRIQESIQKWLYSNRVARGTSIPTDQIREVCGRVAKWATGRATILEGQDENTSDIRDAFLTAAGRASFLGELAESQGRSITEPQLKRLLEESNSIGVYSQPFVEAEGAPIFVSSLSEISGPAKRLIWLGLSAPDASISNWSSQQVEVLRKNGIDVDDGSRRISALRSAEVRGLAQIQESLLAIQIPQDWEQRMHPIWLAVQNQFSEKQQPISIESMIESDQLHLLEPYRFRTSSYPLIEPQPERPEWTLGKGLLIDRETVSASELQDRLACPLKWVFNYQARLSPSSIAHLPDTYQLKGKFCHGVLERVFKGNGMIPTVEDAVSEVGKWFDARLAKDAAPLAQPDQRMERERLRKQLVGATQTLISTLREGGYERIDMEVELDGNAFGKKLVGSVDCVAKKSSGAEAVVDFKFSGKRYRDMLRDGGALQLATYAYGRSRGGSFPSVAYLIITDGSLCTPEESPVGVSTKTDLVEGPPIQTVWDRFEKAVFEADNWLTCEKPIPARPLMESNQWPMGVELVLKSDIRPGDEQDVCRYCNYKQLCGFTRAV